MRFVLGLNVNPVLETLPYVPFSVELLVHWYVTLPTVFAGTVLVKTPCVLPEQIVLFPEIEIVPGVSEV